MTCLYRHMAVAILTLGAGQVYAQQAVATTSEVSDTDANALLARPVSLHVKNATLRQAVDELTDNAKVVIAYQSELADATGRSVTLSVDRQPMGVVLSQILEGTKFRVIVTGPNALALKWVTRSADVMQQGVGTVIGHVYDAKSKAPLRGVKVELDNQSHGESDAKGEYRISGVSAGEHVVSVKLLGYVRATRPVKVSENGTITLDIGLEPTARALEQVVVTGTVIPTEMKAVPNAMTVITAKDIEQRGITHIDQLFRGDVPGLFAVNLGSFSPLGQVLMFSRGATSLGNGTEATKPIKTYVDGVELADPSYLSQIDPRSIERIEILNGPQASTIYGSGALNGVMQIFTKRGSSARPQVTVSLLPGFVQNNYSRSVTSQQDHSMQINGTEGRFSYNAGGSFNYMGPWTPAVQQTITSGFGGGRVQSKQFTVDVSARLTTTVNHQRGDPVEGRTHYVEDGFYSFQGIGTVGLARPDDYTLRGQTLGLTIGYTPTSWWSHEVVIGSDAADIDQRSTAPQYQSQSDTSSFLHQSTDHRTTLRYSTTVQAPLSTWSQLIVSGGVDGWQDITTSFDVRAMSLTGTIVPISQPAIARQPGHNTGAFVQAQWHVRDALFLTYGVRAEWNPNYGDEAQPNYSPRYGVSYVHDVNTPMGVLTAKIRGSYGKSTQPPTVGQRSQILINPATTTNEMLLNYGVYASQLANPLLGPSLQQGGEGGIDLYFGNRASLTITRYNQTTDNLIVRVLGADSVRSIRVNPTFSNGRFRCADEIRLKQPQNCSSQDAQGYGYALVAQNINAASIRNEGWEAEGSTVMGPFTINGTYSWTKSRVLGVTPAYRSAPNLQAQQYQPGTSFNYLPEHSWALGMSYGRGGTSVAFNVRGTGQISGVQDSVYVDELNGYQRLISDMTNVSSFYSYIRPPIGGDFICDLNATHRVSRAVEAVLQVQNLGNFYRNEQDLLGATLGRQVKAGVRLRWE